MQPYYPMVIIAELEIILGLCKYVVSISFPLREQGQHSPFVTHFISGIFYIYMCIYHPNTTARAKRLFLARCSQTALRAVFSPPQSNLKSAALRHEQGKHQGGGGTAPIGSTSAGGTHRAPKLQPGSAAPI